MHQGTHAVCAEAIPDVQALSPEAEAGGAAGAVRLMGGLLDMEPFTLGLFGSPPIAYSELFRAKL